MGGFLDSGTFGQKSQCRLAPGAFLGSVLLQMSTPAPSCLVPGTNTPTEPQPPCTMLPPLQWLSGP